MVDDPGNVGYATVHTVHFPQKGIHQGVALYTALPQRPGAQQLLLDVLVRRIVLAGVGLPDVDEQEVRAIGEVPGQLLHTRNRRDTRRSGDAAELHDDRLAA